MSFREKKAWTVILALLAVFIPYYVLMMRAYHQPDPDYGYLGSLALIALVTFVVLELVLVLVARRLSPDDAGFPKDERDQFFAFKAARVAHVSLIILLIVVTFLMIHSFGRNWGWGMLYLATIICSEILRASILIVQYRRGY